MLAMKAASNVTAPMQFLQVENETYAYRRFGNGVALPLLLLQHFMGTLDNWDPAVTDGLASGREIILFDNAGVGRSSGAVPKTVAGMAMHALAFLEGLGVSACDVLGLTRRNGCPTDGAGKALDFSTDHSPGYRNIGCCHNAKNKLTTNYLYLAEKLGVDVHELHEVYELVPLEGGGFEVRTRHPGWAQRAAHLHHHTYTGGQVIVAAHPYGSSKLLLHLQHKGRLTGLSSQLGQRARTNSEQLLAITRTHGQSTIRVPRELDAPYSLK